MTDHATVKDGLERTGNPEHASVDGVPFRTAAADHDVTAVDSVQIGTVATQLLIDLNTDP